jgi:hypothetical protein
VSIGRAHRQAVSLIHPDGWHRAIRETGKFACPDCADRLDAGDNPLAI